MPYSTQSYNLLVWLKEMQSISLVSCYNDFEGIITVISWGLMGDSFITSFNRWNEKHGIDYSIVRIRHDAWVIYPKNHGVQITDLTNE